MSDSPLIFILAGEASGDLLGGRLMRALQLQTHNKVRFVGVGGETMIAAGLESIFPMSDLSVMGLTEVLTHLPILLKRLKQTEKEVLSLKPAALVTIDAPDFCFRLAKQLRGQGIPHIHYTPPTVWAWRPGRAKKIAKLIDHLLAIYPFEPPYFVKEGLACTFVGHSVTEAGIEKIDPLSFRKKYHIEEGTPLLCLLPGSRKGEVEKLIPIFEQTIALLKKNHSDVQIVVPLAPAVKDFVKQAVQGWQAQVTCVEGQSERYEAMRSCTVALAASGTVNLELVLAATPFVITYKVSALTAWVARRLLKIPYVAMVNILSGREVVPEMLQEKCQPSDLAEAVEQLLSNSALRKKQLEAFQEVKHQLSLPEASPSMVAAKVILNLIQKED